MKARPLPSLEFLHKCFLLDPNSPTGLIWKPRERKYFATQKGHSVFQTRYAGKPAGHMFTRSCGRQYYQVRFQKKLIYSHRLIYALYHNVTLDSDIEIDHIDDCGINNKIDNLRLATHAHNNQNVKLQKNNTSGYKGVVWHKQCKKWVAQISVNYRNISLGLFEDKMDAVGAIREYREKLHREFTNHG